MTSTETADAFVNQLRVRPDLLLTVTPAGAPSTWTIRVQAAEVHDAVRVACSPDSRVTEIKREAMRVLLPDVSALEGYLVKFRGAEVRDEGISLGDLGAQDASLLFIASRTRRPLR